MILSFFCFSHFWVNWILKAPFASFVKKKNTKYIRAWWNFNLLDCSPALFIAQRSRPWLQRELQTSWGTLSKFCCIPCHSLWIMYGTGSTRSHEHFTPTCLLVIHRLAPSLQLGSSDGRLPVQSPTTWKMFK